MAHGRVARDAVVRSLQALQSPTATAAGAVYLTLLGGTIGVVLTLGATRLARSLLFGISPTNAGTFVAVAALFNVVALLACWLPARRVSRIDPVRAMHAERGCKLFFEVVKPPARPSRRR